jgi:hypothetical protein
MRREEWPGVSARLTEIYLADVYLRVPQARSERATRRTELPSLANERPKVVIVEYLHEIRNFAV